MRPVLVIVFPPGFDLAPGIAQTGEPVRFQALIPKPAVEAFDMTVLHRLAITVNIANSTVATFNLGSVIGDLNSSIQQLNGAGHGELAESLKKLTEAIVESGELNNETRKELLEHLTHVLEEAEKLAAKRKMGPLRASIEAIKSTVLTASQLLALWQGVEHELRVHKVIPG